jgi:hypothetical protein
MFCEKTGHFFYVLFYKNRNKLWFLSPFHFNWNSKNLTLNLLQISHYNLEAPFEELNPR